MWGERDEGERGVSVCGGERGECECVWGERDEGERGVRCVEVKGVSVSLCGVRGMRVREG